MKDKVNFENLNDIQKVWLCDLSFVDITEEGHKKISEEGLLIKDLRQYIKNSDMPFCGDILLGPKRFNSLTGVLLGNDKFPSNLDVVDSLIKYGLGELKIKHSSDYPMPPCESGFQALTLEDSFGNIGISYRGSDLYISRVAIREWIESNIGEYFSNISIQANDAREYFLRHKNLNGNNYIYGHSLGGNLVSHVYLDYYDEIKQAFSINGTPINQKLIDTNEKRQAFNDKNKFSFNVVCGDIVSQLKSYEMYKNNINYIKNNDSMKPSILSAHMIQSSAFDNEGNFIKITESEMLEHTNSIIIKLINLSKFITKRVNKTNYKLYHNRNDKYIITKDEQIEQKNNKSI